MVSTVATVALIYHIDFVVGSHIKNQETAMPPKVILIVAAKVAVKVVAAAAVGLGYIIKHHRRKVMIHLGLSLLLCKIYHHKQLAQLLFQTVHRHRVVD